MQLLFGCKLVLGEDVMRMNDYYSKSWTSTGCPELDSFILLAFLLGCHKCTGYWGRRPSFILVMNPLSPLSVPITAQLKERNH